MGTPLLPPGFAAAARTDATQCAHVGEACTIACCLSEGLQCRAGASGGYCTKSCRCRGSAICTPPSFGDGCPQGSLCLATQSDGTGECVVLCDQPPCEVG